VKACGPNTGPLILATPHLILGARAALLSFALAIADADHRDIPS
jgi:hypothetical protein